MDTVIAVSIVAIALVWAVARIVHRVQVMPPPAGIRLAALALAAVAFVPARAAPAQEESAKASDSPALRQSIDNFKGAFESASHGLSLSGFFDMDLTTPGNDPNLVSPGDFEVDFSRNFGRNTQTAAAVVANGDGASLAVGFIDIHCFGALIAPRGRLPVEKGFHIQIGRFDVPFGNDWQYFASKDRVELSAPLTTGDIMDGGYNDTGLRILGKSQSVDYSAVILRGSGGKRVVGGRLGLTPFDDPYHFNPHTRAFEAGLSLLQRVGGSGATGARMISVDSQSQLHALHVRGEYVRKDCRGAAGIGSRGVKSGWHLTASFDAGTLRGVLLLPYARYDTVRDDAVSDGLSRTERLTGGINSTLFRVVNLKVEYQRALINPAIAGRNAWSAQAVFIF